MASSQLNSRAVPNQHKQRPQRWRRERDSTGLSSPKLSGTTEIQRFTAPIAGFVAFDHVWDHTALSRSISRRNTRIGHKSVTWNGTSCPPRIV